MIQAVIFDYGGVLEDFDYDAMLQKLAPYTNLPIDELRRIIKTPALDRIEYETGIITTDEFCRRIMTECAINMPRELFEEKYGRIFTPKQRSFELVRSLFNNGYQLAILSNTSELHYKYGISRMPISRFFDTITMSYENDVKAMKPANRIFDVCLARAELPPNECAYIDDVAEYAQKAELLGMHGIHYQNHEQVVEELRKLGVRLTV